MHHAEAVRVAGRSRKLAEQITTDYRQAGLSDKDRAMLDYVAKLTRTPGEMVEVDVQTLREHDFSDRAILDIAIMAGLFAYLNRLASGLGVELEETYQGHGKETANA